MKKILYILAGITAMFVTASCARENVPAAKGDAATATFTIALPDQVATKAISDGLTAKNLLFYVYDENGKYLPELTIDDKTFTDKKTTINVQLVKGLKYSFGFIAVADGNASSAYAFDPATKAITVDYSKMTANDDQFDLFTAALNDFEVTGPFSQTITLTRPLAQVNFGTTEEDINAAKASGILTDDMKTALTFSEVGSAMNFLTGEVTATAQDVLVAAKVRPAETLTVNGTAYEWVAMAYVLTGADKALNDVSLDAEIANADGPMTPLQRSVANVPIQRNHRTNIIGNLFSVTGEFIIIIDEIFETPDYDYTNTLQLAFFKGGEVTLEKDEVIEHQLVVPAGSNVILNLNGHTISNTEDIWAGDNWSLISVQGGSLTIKGEGKLDAKENDCYALDIRDGGSLIVEGGEIIGNITAVYVYEGTADIRGGKFSLKQLTDGTGEAPYRYTINLLDAAGRDGSASAIVSGGSFYMFDPGNNAAEGAGTNFLDDGVATTLQDSWYNVTLAEYELAPLVEAAEAGSVLVLQSGRYNAGAWTKVSKDLTIKAEKPGKAVIDGKLTIDNGKTLKVEGLVFQNDHDYTVPKATHQYHNKTGASQLSAYAGSIEAKNCKFVSKTIYASIDNYGNGEDHHLLVENCEFSSTAAEHRPIKAYGHVTVTGCTFNNLTDDPGYCVQYYTGGGSTWYCTFTNNTVQKTLPGGETSVGISISKSTAVDSAHPVLFTIKGNTAGLRYTWTLNKPSINFDEGATMSDDSDVAKSDWVGVEK